MTLEPGRRFGKYEIVTMLGQGGMGEVYLAKDPQLNRDIAIKVLAPNLTQDRGQLIRFRKEASLAARLNHPNICTIYETGEIEGQTYICMEYIEGVTLREYLSSRPISVDETLDISIQIADALEEARRRNVVHRDIKSGNILLTSRRLVKVLDFGLAKRLEVQNEQDRSDIPTSSTSSQPGIVRGTISYMSPEMALGKPADHRSDIFSFGVVIYEMLSGRLPFVGSSVTEVVDGILHKDPPPVTRYNDKVPDTLVRILNKMLEKDPENRYQSVHEIWVDLKRIKEEITDRSILRTSSISDTIPGKLGSQPYRFRKMSFLTAAAVFVSILVGAYFFFINKTPKSIPTETVEKRHSIVILPFKNKSGDQSLNRLRLALTQIVIDDLIPSKHIKVLPYERLYQFSDLIKNIDDEIYDTNLLRKIGKFSNAQALVQSDILKFGNVWQILIEFKDSSTGETTYSRKIVKESEESGEKVLFDLVENVTFEISLQYGTPTNELADTRPTQESNAISNEALILYNEGVNQLYQSNNLKAVTFLSNSIEKNPSYAMAHARLALAHKNLGYDELARRSAKNALDLMRQDLSMIDAYFIEATYAEANYDHAKAIQLYERLAKIYADSPEIHFRLGLLFEKTTLYQNALASYQKAIRSDPNYATAYQRTGILYGLSKEPKEALQNFKKALDLYVNIGNIEGKARVLSGIGNFHMHQQQYAESRKFHQQAFQIDQSINSKSGIAEDLHNIGLSYLNQGNTKEGTPFIEKALQLFTEVGDKLSIAKAYIDVGNSDFYRGNYEKALHFYLKSLDIAKEIKNKQLLADCYYAISGPHYFMNRYDQATKYARDALAEYTRLGHKRGIVQSTMQLADNKYELGDYTGARNLVRQALVISRNIQDRELTAGSLSLIAHLNYLQAYYQQALQERSEALKLYKAIDHGRGVVYSQLNMALIYSSLGAYDQAEPMFDEPLHYFIENDNQYMRAYCLFHIGRLHKLRARSNSAPLAEKYFEEALKYALESKSNDYILLAKAHLSLLWWDRNELTKARSTYAEIRETNQSQFQQKELMPELYLMLASLGYVLKEYDRSLRETQSAIEIAQPLNLRGDLFSAYYYMAKVKVAQNQSMQAVELYEKSAGLLEAIAHDLSKNYLQTFFQRRDVQAVYKDLVNLLDKMGKKQEAEKYSIRLAKKL